MKSNTGIWVALVAVAIIAVAAIAMPKTIQVQVQQPTTQNFGGVTNYDSIQLSKVGTSTLTQVGCYQGYATSTATPIIFTYGNQPTTTITGTSPSNGVVAWHYGTCGRAPGL